MKVTESEVGREEEGERERERDEQPDKRTERKYQVFILMITLPFTENFTPYG